MVLSTNFIGATGHWQREEGRRRKKEAEGEGGGQEKTGSPESHNVHKMYSKLVMNLNLKCKNIKFMYVREKREGPKNRISLRPGNRQRVFRHQRPKRGMGGK